MKRLLSILIIGVLSLSLGACSQYSSIQPSETNANEEKTNTNEEEITQTTNDNVLIAYYSYSGNTKAAAEEIQRQAGGELAEIIRIEEYPSDFYDMAEQEIINGKQPEISLSVENIDDYDVIFVGYPIWWKEAPAMINTFINQFDFTGKIVVPFCTSSSDGIEESLDVFDAIKDQGIVTEGLRISDYEDIAGWLKAVNIIE